jgi:lysophospholipase L1-like esterase
MKMALAGIAFASLLPAQAVISTRTDLAVERTDRNSQVAHEQLIEKKDKGRIDVYFEGDSIVRRWGATDHPQLLENWRQNFFGWNAADFGWGADRVENILWRLQHGELDGVNPKAIVLLAGTNNVGIDTASENVAKGISAVLHVMREKAPNAVIVLMGIFPRNDNMAVMPEIDAINIKLSKMADGRGIRYLNINDKLADSSGKLYPGMMNADDKLHPAIAGYQVWADALKPLLTEILGPPEKEDHAPPPTANPGVN